MKTASIIISCNDIKWIIHKVTSFLLDLGANIINLEQHIENWIFFMRIEWDLKDFKLNENQFKEKFKSIQNKYAMGLTLNFQNGKNKIALFCSKELHCLLDIINRKNIDELSIDISFVASNFQDAKKYAQAFKIPFYYIENWNNQEDKLLELVNKYDIECIWLARYMKVLSEDFLIKSKLPIINVHHSFLPSFIWAKPYDDAYEKGVKIIWATSHYVTKELDQWQIIDQETLKIRHINSINELKTLWRKCEKEVFSTALKKHLENKIIIYGNRTIIFN